MLSFYLIAVYGALNTDFFGHALVVAVALDRSYYACLYDCSVDRYGPRYDLLPSTYLVATINATCIRGIVYRP